MSLHKTPLAAAHLQGNKGLGMLKSNKPDTTFPQQQMLGDSQAAFLYITLLANPAGSSSIYQMCMANSKHLPPVH